MALSVHITKTLGTFRLRVDFETDREVMALLGASGCGKSMTLKCIAGIETPDSGTIVLNNRTLFDSEKHIDLPPQKRRVGYLFQQYALFPNMTVLQNLIAGVRGGARAEKRALALEKLRAFGLEGLERRKPNQLSGGQQQRVALARILLNQPEVLLLDEPFAALDSYLKWRLETELADTLREFGGDVLYVSHDLNEVYHLCNTVCVLTDGRSEKKSEVDRLVAAPGTVSAALLSGVRNISDVRRTDERHVYCTAWDVTLECAAPCTAVGIRDLAVVPSGEANGFSCRVLRLTREMSGGTALLRPPGEQLLRMELSTEEWAALSVGQTVTVAPTRILPLSEEQS